MILITMPGLGSIYSIQRSVNAILKLESCAGEIDSQEKTGTLSEPVDDIGAAFAAMRENLGQFLPFQ
jgi:hypothetical protein